MTAPHRLDAPLPECLTCSACGHELRLDNPTPGFGEPAYRHPAGVRCEQRRLNEVEIASAYRHAAAAEDEEVA